MPKRTSTPTSTPAPSTPDSQQVGRDPASTPDADRSAQRAARRAADGAENRGRRRPSDRVLDLLLLAAERDDARVELTVTVGGTVVTGTLVGTLAYCRALADQFVSRLGGTVMDEEFAEGFRDLVDEAAGIAAGDRRHPPDPAAYEQSVAFLHLADARYVSPAGLLPQGRHGVLWRCPVADVCSWSIGDLIPH